MGKQSTKLKSLAKRAKGRLSNGFWNEYRENVNNTSDANQSNRSEILNYYRTKAIRELSSSEEEEFYNKVKYILDTFGDVSDIIGRLCDDEVLNKLDFEAQERYVFELCDKYLQCRDRYEQEKKYEKMLEDAKDRGIS